MATIVLSAAGMALGGGVGGSVLGLSMATVGRAAGAAVGQMIDRRLLGQGAEPVETGRIDRLRLTGASEGAPVPNVYGRYRVAGQVIWANRFQEDQTTTGGGKGSPRPTVTSYSYTVSLAIALCEGQINGIGRIWADGEELTRDAIPMRVYHGTDDQQPDPRIEAVEGAGAVPAYRGIAYVVIEDLDITAFGNRIPQFTFEVVRTSQPDAVERDVSDLVQGVALMPGTGEFALSTTPLTRKDGLGAYSSVNINSASGMTDLATSLDDLTRDLPRAKAASLIVSWFGDDLRCGECRVGPRAENAGPEPQEATWTVSGVTRDQAGLVPYERDNALYGGTPSDASVVQAIAALRAKGIAPMFYPFLLMEQKADNTLTDPYTGQTGQPALPWRGRITTDLAPSVAGSSDHTAAATAQVDAFFGTAQPSDWDANGTYTGPEEWSYRRFILHYAHLCARAGGVDAFCVGSEMRGLTTIRDGNGDFPAVAQLIQLAREVRAILPDAKIGYAADWSEYHGYTPIGTADKLFHLDPLWADEAIDFIGIDNYLPLSDWPAGNDHLDAEHEAIYDLDYLQSNIEGGEYYDWYYHSPEARAAQIRTPITDGMEEPWIWRTKDIRNWWANYHTNRINCEKAGVTAWEPMSKPIWFTEYGCAAIDKGTNEPNKFLDPKSSESAWPVHSNGQRDDLMQAQYIRALTQYYGNTENNPVSPVYGGKMLDTTRAFVWAWDARPFPYFPANDALWSDGENYAHGHWLTGRASARTLASVVTEVCHRAGLTAIDTSRLFGIVRGYAVADNGTARQALQPLMVAYGFDAVERNGTLHFISRGIPQPVDIDPALVVANDDGDIQKTRAPEAETAGRVRVGYVEATGDYQTRISDAVQHGAANSTSQTEYPLLLTGGEAKRIAERWLSETTIARETLSLALPLSRTDVNAGAVIALGGHQYRVDRLELTEAQQLDCVRIDDTVYDVPEVTEDTAHLRHFTPPLPLDGLFLDLPYIHRDQKGEGLHFAAFGTPWPGSVALYQSTDDSDYAAAALVRRSATVGELLDDMPKADPARWDRGQAVRVKLAKGALSGVSARRILKGANLAALGDGTPDGWEVIQFQSAELVAPDTYALTLRLRGQQDTTPQFWPAGTLFVLLDEAVTPIDPAITTPWVSHHFRYGPATRALGDSTYRHAEVTPTGAALRPYAPCHLRARAQAARHLLSWVRRGRVDGDSWNGIDIPLAEERESYLLRIFVGGILKREVITEAPSYDYTVAQQASDGATAGFGFSVQQVSATVGAGRVAELAV